MIPFYPHRQPDWSRARQLVAQLEYERDVREREQQLEPMTAIEWSPAQQCRKYVEDVA